METVVKLYSTHKNEINRFLNSFFASNMLNDYNPSILEWQKSTKIQLKSWILLVLLLKIMINLKLICGLV